MREGTIVAPPFSRDEEKGRDCSRITSIAFTVYPVSNMERARACYEHVLGLHASSNDRDEWVIYEAGGSSFAVTTTEMGHTPSAKGAVAAFEVSDLEAFVHTMEERAVSFVTEVFDTPVGRMAVIEDPGGNHMTIQKRHA